MLADAGGRVGVVVEDVVGVKVLGVVGVWVTVGLKVGSPVDRDTCVNPVLLIMEMMLMELVLVPVLVWVLAIKLQQNLILQKMWKEDQKDHHIVFDTMGSMCSKEEKCKLGQ